MTITINTPDSSISYDFSDIPKKGDSIVIDNKHWIVMSATWVLEDNIYKPIIHVY